jgi:hypothetical protein
MFNIACYISVKACNLRYIFDKQKFAKCKKLIKKRSKMIEISRIIKSILVVTTTTPRKTKPTEPPVTTPTTTDKPDIDYYCPDKVRAIAREFAFMIFLWFR